VYNYENMIIGLNDKTY